MCHASDKCSTTMSEVGMLAQQLSIQLTHALIMCTRDRTRLYGLVCACSALARVVLGEAVQTNTADVWFHGLHRDGPSAEFDVLVDQAVSARGASIQVRKPRWGSRGFLGAETRFTRSCRPVVSFQQHECSTSIVRASTSQRCSSQDMDAQGL